jgi:thioredoxin-dependent peroxiredoxin
MEPHTPLSRAGAAKFPATDGAGSDFPHHVRPTARGPFKTKLKLETLVLCDYTHFTGRTRGANRRTDIAIRRSIPYDEESSMNKILSNAPPKNLNKNSDSRLGENLGKKLAPGDKAPDFVLPDAAGTRISLASFAGRKLVLYFYPKDDTSGCTKEAIDFNGLSGEFKKAGAAILGVSPDPVASHARFKAKHKLEFALASDESKAMLEAYGVWVEKSMYGRKYMGIERTTFVIGTDRQIAMVWNRVKVPDHAEAVLAAVKAL